MEFLWKVGFLDVKHTGIFKVFDITIWRAWITISAKIVFLIKMLPTILINWNRSKSPLNNRTSWLHHNTRNASFPSSCTWLSCCMLLLVALGNDIHSKLYEDERSLETWQPKSISRGRSFQYFRISRALFCKHINQLYVFSFTATSDVSAAIIALPWW